MNPRFRKFFINNLIISLVLVVIGGILFATVLKDYYQVIYPFLLLYVLAINLFVFYLVTRPKKKQMNYSVEIAITFVFRFVAYLTAALLYFIFMKNTTDRIVFTLVLFILYIIFVGVEVIVLSKFFKTNHQSIKN